MLHCTFVLEDTVLTATGNDKPGAFVWDIEACDMFAGKTHKGTLTNVQLSAILALAVGYGEEEEAKAEVTAELYRIAEEATKDWEVRIFP